MAGRQRTPILKYGKGNNFNKFKSAVKELAARKPYTGIKQGAFEMLAQYSKCFHETYKGYNNIGTVNEPVAVSEKVQAMDFFHGLDARR